jgi:hypothetical protein
VAAGCVDFVPEAGAFFAAGTFAAAAFGLLLLEAVFAAGGLGLIVFALLGTGDFPVGFRFLLPDAGSSYPSLLVSLMCSLPLSSVLSLPRLDSALLLPSEKYPDFAFETGFLVASFRATGVFVIVAFGALALLPAFATLALLMVLLGGETGAASSSVAVLPESSLLSLPLKLRSSSSSPSLSL